MSSANTRQVLSKTSHMNLASLNINAIESIKVQRLMGIIALTNTKLIGNIYFVEYITAL